MSRAGSAPLQRTRDLLAIAGFLVHRLQKVEVSKNGDVVKFRT